MKNKRYRELAAILVMMTMTAGSITTVAAETETAAEEETTAETEPAADEPQQKQKLPMRWNRNCRGCRFRGSRNSRYQVPGGSPGSN